MHPRCVGYLMHSLMARRGPEREARIENEVAKAIRFANDHGEWPIDMSPAAGRALVRRGDGEDLQRRWGDIVEAVLQDR